MVGRSQSIVCRAVDVFNIFSDKTVPSPVENLGRANSSCIRDTASHRIWRLGVRVSWW